MTGSAQPILNSNNWWAFWLRSVTALWWGKKRQSVQKHCTSWDQISFNNQFVHIFHTIFHGCTFPFFIFLRINNHESKPSASSVTFVTEAIGFYEIEYSMIWYYIYTSTNSLWKLHTYLCSITETTRISKRFEKQKKTRWWRKRLRKQWNIYSNRVLLISCQSI